MATSFQQAHSEAWYKIGIGSKERPFEVFPKYKKQEFDALKTDYNNKYGYTVRIPQWDDVVHLVPNALKSKEMIKAEKKEALVRILESPATDWMRTITTVMTWIDDIQDTVSVVYPLLKLFSKVAPKAFYKLTPIIGWIATGYELLNLLNGFTHFKYTKMSAKRAVCPNYRSSPFSKRSRFLKAENIKRWKPNIADALQAAQVLDQVSGFGLSFGGIMGTITDAAFGLYRYATGQPVKFSFDPPDISTLDTMGARGLRAAQAISSQGQVFSELQHFWTYITAGLSTAALAPTFRDAELAELIEDPMEMMIPAPEPRDPLTIEVIKEAGLNVEAGIGWPFNGEKFISAGDLIDATAEPCRANFVAYCNRHDKDSYGWLAAAAMDTMIPNVILAIDPNATLDMDDTDQMKIFYKMVKAPVLPTTPYTENQVSDFWDWALGYTDLYQKTPGILEIESKLEQLGIKFLTSYPAESSPDVDNFFPPGYTAEEAL